MFRLKPMNTRGPMTFSGKSQVVGTDAGFWVATLSNFIVRTPEQIREWRGLIADLQGGLNDLVIGAFDCRQAPRVAGRPPVIGGITHSDGSLFSDKSGYRQSTIKVVAARDAAVRATSLRINVQEAGKLERGMYFTIWSLVAGVMLPRMYMLTKTPEVSGSAATIQFLPPLRVAVKEGDEVDFADPKLAMNLASDDGGDLDIRMRRFSSPSLELQESWNGLS
jgi:hypothetical protein